MKYKTSLLHAQYKSMASWVNTYLSKLSDDDLKRTLGTGLNHGIWLLGHLIASDDDLSMYMGKGATLYPDYADMFGQGSTLKPVEQYPPANILREAWKNVVEKNTKIYSELTDEELNDPHEMLKGSIEDDYFKTKENVAINWLLHQMYVCGQLSILNRLSGKKGLV